MEETLNLFGEISMTEYLSEVPMLVYTNICNMGSKQEESEVCVQKQDYAGLHIAHWDHGDMGHSSHTCHNTVTGYRLFGNNTLAW